MDSVSMITTTMLLTAFGVSHGILAIKFMLKQSQSDFKQELKGEALIIDLLKKRLLISKHKRVYVFGNDRGIWLANAKQCLQDTE